MNSQNTPVHVKLWHREFWQMAVANLLLFMSVYMLIPVLPLWLMQTLRLTGVQTGVAMGIFAIGLYLMGPLCSYLVQHYRRNVVCLWAIIAQAVSIGGLWYFDTLQPEGVRLGMVLVQRLALGASFGLAQMVLSSTLIIDTCESFQRTEANHSAAWFGRFALSLGPLTGLLLWQTADFSTIMITAVGCSLVAMLLISAVDFPFRAPEEHIHLFSADRFLLGQGSVLFINLLLVTMALGAIMALPLSAEFYAMMMVGFLLALLAQRFAFRDAELKSEVVTGLILMTAAELILLTQQTASAWLIASAFVGMAVGIIGTRFLLFFIKLSRHCQRGTSQSTFMLAWETGLAFGLCGGYCLTEWLPETGVVGLSIILTLSALTLYNYCTHTWFMGHKNR